MPWLAGVHTVTIDPHRGYANGVTEKLAHATRDVDPFHRRVPGQHGHR
jgi:hypothetical protein